jgi:AcrR family transcriptional regulator
METDGKPSKPAAPTSQRELRKNEKKAAIEKASKKIFLEKGYSAASVDEIARLAGITKRTLYSYYPSKLALFVHVFDEYLQRLSAQITKAASAEGTLLERLVATLTTLFDFTRKNQKFMLLYWMLDSREADGHIPEELIEHVQQWTDAMMRSSLELVLAGQEEEYLRDLDPRLIVHLMSAVNKGIIVHAQKEKRFELADIDARALQVTFAQLLDGGLFQEGRTPPAGKSSGSKKGSSGARSDGSGAKPPAGNNRRSKK